jgi:hypothetical protein
VAQLVVDGARISGAHILTGSVQWLSGEFDSGSTSIPTGSALVLNSASELFAKAHSFTIAGTLIHEGPGAFRGASGTGVNILTGGLYDLRSDGGFFVAAGDGEASLNNAGTLRKSGGDGIASFSRGGQVFALNNSGLVEVQRGTLVLAHAGTQSGVFEVADGARLTDRGPGQTFQSGVQVYRHRPGGNHGGPRRPRGVSQHESDARQRIARAALTRSAQLLWEGGERLAASQQLPGARCSR